MTLLAARVAAQDQPATGLAGGRAFQTISGGHPCGVGSRKGGAFDLLNLLLIRLPDSPATHSNHRPYFLLYK